MNETMNQAASSSSIPAALFVLVIVGALAGYFFMKRRGGVHVEKKDVLTHEDVMDRVRKKLDK